MPGPPKVALLIETARGYGRQMLLGIVRYARLHGPSGGLRHAGRFRTGLAEDAAVGRHEFVLRSEQR